VFPQKKRKSCDVMAESSALHLADLLVTVALVERDHNGDTIVVWNYPGASAAMDDHILKRCVLEMEKDSTSLADALKSEAVGAVGR
jgi:hypothetical protein